MAAQTEQWEQSKNRHPLIRYEKEELRWRCIAKQLAHVQLAAVQQRWAGYKKVPNQWGMALRCTHSLGFLLICHLQPHYDSVQRCFLSLNYSCHKGLSRQTYRARIIIWVLTVSFHKDDANPNCCSDKQWAALLRIGSAGIDWSVFVNITAEWVEFYSEEWVGFLNHQLETQN